MGGHEIDEDRFHLTTEGRSISPCAAIGTGAFLVEYFELALVDANIVSTQYTTVARTLAALLGGALGFWA